MLKLTGGQLMGMRNVAARVSGPVYQILKGLGLLKLAHHGVSAGQRRRRRIEKPIILELINIRSLNNKADLIHERIIDNDVGIMAITETWHKKSDKITEKDLCPPGHSFLGAPRPASKGRKGGGLGFVIAPTIRASRTENDDYETFEALSVKIKSQPPLTMALIYRQPPSATNQLTRSAFLAEFEEFLSSLCSRINGNLCLLGDFNIHWDDENDSIASRFLDIVPACCLDVTNAHAPFRQITLKGDGMKPWYSDAIHSAHVVRRKYERQFRKSPLEVHGQIYVDQCKEVVQLIQNTKKEYFHQKFASASAKEVFRLVDNLLHKEPNHTLLTNVALGDLPQTFNKFFYDKVHQIRAELDASPTLPSLTTPQPLVAERGGAPGLETFEICSAEDLRKIIQTSGSKT
ncbi:hypothetical protein CAPTEDRAFT_206918 [Capitella teleta]|uniref:Endonuclease/exonuclease/phosphatase domain-containing protein n=1 Tax=Capitella teleta TaxID=283909 RepID=R7V218_CAPTE|nr:hypothetical protein CAPTEDRAFT_206918 [Capitella teleta]|eukprot:ELU09726.1 hypothetical protein CAPTEDRAFT_206918 [Capitella teleta]